MKPPKEVHKGWESETEGLSESQLAEVLGTSYQNVQQCVKRYIRKLRWPPGERSNWPSGGKAYAARRRKKKDV